MNDRMLHLAVELTGLELGLAPFDQAILAGILVRAEELAAQGETDFSFCELDTDLQPWDRAGGPKRPLIDLYDKRRIWVYGDYELITPQRPPNWP